MCIYSDDLDKIEITSEIIFLTLVATIVKNTYYQKSHYYIKY